jgi:hypothetical protein
MEALSQDRNRAQKGRPRRIGARLEKSTKNLGASRPRRSVHRWPAPTADWRWLLAPEQTASAATGRGNEASDGAIEVPQLPPFGGGEGPVVAEAGLRIPRVYHVADTLDPRIAIAGPAWADLVQVGSTLLGELPANIAVHDR